MSKESGKRTRRIVALTGGAVVVSAAVALPALASTTSADASDSAAAVVADVAIPRGPSAAVSPSTVIADWYGSASDVEKAQFAYLTATDAEKARFTLMLAGEEERAAFTFFVMTPEQREAFVVLTTPPPPPPPAPVATVSGGSSSYGGGGGYLDCVRGRESGGNYGAVNGSSGAGGAYQFMPQTWNNTAAYAGRPDLVGTNPASASPADQDAMAQALYQWQGGAPWAGPGC